MAASEYDLCLQVGEQIRQRRVQLKMNQSEPFTVSRPGSPVARWAICFAFCRRLGYLPTTSFAPRSRSRNSLTWRGSGTTCRRRKRFCSIQPPKRWPKQCCVCRRSARRSVHEPLFLNCPLQGAKPHKMHLVSCCVLPKIQVQYNQGINNPVRQDGFGVLAGCTLKSK